MTIAEKQEEIIEEFALFDDWMARYEHMIELGKTLPLVDPDRKTDDKLIKGCQSRVWLDAGMDNGNMIFTADSDAVITKGIIAILIRVLSEQPPQEVAEANMDFIDEIGLKEHLSPTRANGLVSMIKQMKLYGLAYAAQQKTE